MDNTLSPSSTNAIANKAVYDGLEAIGAQIASEYNSSTSYVVGDLVTHESKLYVCKEDCNGTWDASKWMLTKVSTVFNNLRSGIAPKFSANTHYAVGDYCMYANVLWRFTADHYGTWSNDDVTSVSLAGTKANLDDIAPVFSTAVSYVKGDMVTYQGDLYVFLQDHLGYWIGAHAQRTNVSDRIMSEETRAVTAETALSSAVALKADQAFAEYIALREEEDRQILMGSIAQAVQDTYNELRSAPIHNSVTIDGQAYPRMDNTRLGMDEMKGRTVAFNQLAALANPATKTFDADASYYGTFGSFDSAIHLVSGHKYFVAADVARSIATNNYIDIGFGYPVGAPTVTLKNGDADGHVENISTTTLTGNYLGVAYNNYLGKQAINTGDSISVSKPVLIDLTAMYGSTLANSSYAMEQATAGTGVAYVRARLPLAYYAYNPGTLTAPNVSGWSVTGFNLWDEQWELGGFDGVTGEKTASTTSIRSKNYIPVIGGKQYFIAAPTDSLGLYAYDADKNYIGRWNGANFSKVGGFNYADNTVIAFPDNCAFVMLNMAASYPLTYNHDICINVSKATGSPKNGDYLPYQHTALSFTSTRLDGVGSAQDVLAAVEVSENDYTLKKIAKMKLVDLGSLTWEYREADKPNKFFRATISDSKIDNTTSGNTNVIMPRYDWANGYTMLNTTGYDKCYNLGTNNLVANSHYLAIIDSAYTDATQFKNSLNGVYLAYEVDTPVESIVAEHLTLAEVSAIAENGGIISVTNSNGDIVQPDMVVDAVVSRSAS